MKKLLIVLSVIVVLVAAAAVVIPRLVPLADIQQIVKDKVRAQTGREIAFNGAEFRIFPAIALRLEDVTFSNATWAKDKHMMTLAALDVQLALKPLFQKRVVVDRFILESPVIHLETAPSGKGNWEFPAQEPRAQEATASDTGAAGKDFQVTLGTFRISKGELTFADQKKGTVERLSGIDMDIDFPDIASALKLDGAFDYKGQRVTLALMLEKPMALADGGKSPGKLSVKTTGATADIAGVFAREGTMLAGTIDADISSLSGILAWVNGGAAPELPFEKIAFKSGAEAGAERIRLTGATLELDDISATGDVTVGLQGKPSVTARLAIGKLNLDRFIAAGTDVDAKPATKKQGAEGWDATPINFSAMNALNADVVLDTAGFSLKGAEVGPSKITAVLKDGLLQFSSSEASLFDGKFLSSLKLDVTGTTPDMAASFKMMGVQAQPVLKTFADFQKLSGTVNANVSVTSFGNSQQAIVGNLDGKAALMFRDGAIEGIDLVNIAQLVQKRLANMSIGAGKTEFVEMGGSFRITSGVMHNEDFKMKGPLVQATGAGDVFLPRKYVDYRVTPVLTASSAVEGAGGLSVPVNIKGPFSNLKITPDYASVVQDVLKDPGQAADNLKQQGKQLEDVFQDVKKGVKEDPARALDSLLGTGLFGGAPPQPEPQPETDAEAGQQAEEPQTQVQQEQPAPAQEPAVGTP